MKEEQYFLTFRDISKKLVEIDIDTISDFKKLIDSAEKIDCNNKIPVVKIETKNKIYKVQPLMSCNAIFDYKLREIIYINPDSITVNYDLKYPIDSLKAILKRQLNNPLNDKDYPLTNEKRLISINVDSTKKILETKDLLLKIIKTVNQIKTKNNFSFMFENRGIIKINL